VHHFDGAAAIRHSFARNVQQFSLRLWGSVIVVKAGEDMIDVAIRFLGVLDLGRLPMMVGR
jgi:hypothetical protein